MRVIAGDLKSRVIKTPKGEKVRPTSDRVRESVFSVVGECVVDSCALDLFAGAGSLGIEAISRGASHVTFVESSPDVAKVLEYNTSQLKIEDRATVREGDVFKVLKGLSTRRARFGIVFMDPPYSKDLAHKGMEALSSSAVVADGGLVVVQHGKRDPLDEDYGELVLVRVLEFGETRVSIYRRGACER
jgi:16S rRNA (guanine(966)-N(2))-methyltransferase RsmD